MINYDLPSDAEEYVHRIGRTGRVGNPGKSISFYDAEHDAAIAAKLVEKLVLSNAEVPSFLQTAMPFGYGGETSSSTFNSRDIRRVNTFLPISFTSNQLLMKLFCSVRRWWWDGKCSSSSRSRRRLGLKCLVESSNLLTSSKSIPVSFHCSVTIIVEKQKLGTQVIKAMSVLFCQIVRSFDFS